MVFHARSMIYIHIAVFLFGTAGLFGKLVTMDASHLVLGRTFFAALFLIVPVFLSTKKQRETLPTRKFLVLIVSGSLLAIHWYAFFYAIQISTVAIGLITFSSYPVFTAVLEPMIFRIRMTKQDGLISVVVVSGLVMVVPEYDFKNSITLGAVWGVVAGFTFAVLQLMNRRLLKKFTSTQLSFGQNCFATLVLALLFGLPASVDVTPLNIGLLIVLGVMCTAVAHTFFIKGLETETAHTASVIAGLEPVYGIVLACIILGEVPNIRTIAGGIIIIGAVILASVIRLDHKQSG